MDFDFLWVFWCSSGSCGVGDWWRGRSGVGSLFSSDFCRWYVVVCYKCLVFFSLMGLNCKVLYIEGKKKEEWEYKVCEVIELIWLVIICDGNCLKVYNLFIDMLINGGLIWGLFFGIFLLGFVFKEVF